MNDPYYPSVEAYTADIVAARDAYAADMAVQRGDCETCQQRRKDGAHRKCWGCRVKTPEGGGDPAVAAVVENGTNGVAALPEPRPPVVIHPCGNPRCVDPDCLRLVDPEACSICGHRVRGSGPVAAHLLAHLDAAEASL